MNLDEFINKDNLPGQIYETLEAPKALNKLPAITTDKVQLYIPMAPPLAHVGYLCGGVNVVY